MTRWFRFYDETLNDPKILKLSDSLFRIWVGLLCVASKNNGVLPPLDDLVLMLRMKADKVQSALDSLKKSGLIDDDGSSLSPHNWSGRQYKTDNSSERVQKYRNKRKASGLPILGDYSAFRASLVERDGNECVYCLCQGPLVVDHMEPIALGGTDDLLNLALACKPCNSGKSGRTPEMARMKIKVTSARDALERYRVTRPSVTVTETAPETEQIQSRTEQIKKREVAPRAVKRALPLPIGWQPSARAFEIAEQHGQNVQVVESIFRDYLASSGKLYRDYDAAFHNFIRNQHSFNRGGSSNGRAKSPLISAADDLCRKIAEFDGPSRQPEQLRSGAGENVTRLLSNGRG